MTMFQPRTRVFSVWCVLLVGMVAPAVVAQKMVILVRHAEKDPSGDTDDPTLSEAGQQRARRLGDLLRDAGVSAIYVSQFQRTALTVAPLAERLEIVPTRVPASAPLRTLERIRQDHPDGVVLVSGHSDTVPELLQLLGHEEPVFIEDTEYDNLFFVIPRGGGNDPVVLRLRF